MINSITLLQLLKPTFLFTFDLKRLGRMLAVPAAVISVLLLAESFYPLFFLAETAEIRLAVNFYMLGAFAVVILFFAMSLMLRTQQIIFFGDSVEKIFLPPVNKTLFGYFIRICHIFIHSLFLAAIVAYALLFVIKHFMPLPDKANFFALIGAAALLPYFMVRFCVILPAGVAGKKLRFRDAWKMTRRIGSLTALNFALFLLFPFGVSIVLYTFVRNIIENVAVISFFMNFCALFSLMIASVLQSAYSAYLYSTLSDQD